MRIAILFSALSLVAAPAAIAGEQITLGAGVFDVTQTNAIAQFSGEYRGDYLWHGLRPIIGASIDEEGGLYGYGGLNYDLFLSDHWVLTPNFAVGAYHQGDSKDLGHALEFRSGLELGYEFDNKSRLSTTFNHISNASLGDKNPGAESWMLLYSHPVNLLGE